MKFMVTFTGKPAHFKEAISRFLKTGAAPPEGVKMLGRWHGPFAGWVLAETDDLKKVYEWTTQWSDLLEFTVVQVITFADSVCVFTLKGEDVGQKTLYARVGHGRHRLPYMPFGRLRGIPDCPKTVSAQ